MPIDMPKEWSQIRQSLSKNAAVYSQPEKLIQLLDLCATSLSLRQLIVQLSLSRLLFCRYAGDTSYPCLYAIKDKYVVSDFTNDERHFFTDFGELRTFVEDRIARINNEQLVIDLENWDD